MKRFGVLLAECLHDGIGHQLKTEWTIVEFSRGIYESSDMISRFINSSDEPIPGPPKMNDICQKFLPLGHESPIEDIKKVEQLRNAWKLQREERRGGASQRGVSSNDLTIRREKNKDDREQTSVDQNVVRRVGLSSSEIDEHTTQAQGATPVSKQLFALPKENRFARWVLRSVK